MANLQRSQLFQWNWSLSLLGWTLPTAAIFILLSSLFTVLYFIANDSGTRKQKWPPGPPRLPMVGNLHQLKGHLHVAFTEMAKTYGPVMTIWFGNAPTVVVNGHEAAWDALVTQGSNFASRSLQFSRRLITADYTTISATEYGAHWFKLRKALQNSVLSPFHVASQRSSYERDVISLIEKLVKEMNSNDGIVRHPLHDFKVMATSYICRLCFGSEFHDFNFVQKMEELVAQDIKLIGDSLLVNMLPFTRFFLPSSMRVLRRQKALEYEVVKLLSPVIQIYRTRRSIKESAADPNCFLDCLLSVQAGDDCEFSDRVIALNLFELFLLSVDSTSTALEWALAFLITHPEIQQKAYEELSAAVPGEGCVSSEDLVKLPYLQAIVKETLRKEGIAPLAIPHQTVEDCKLMGFHIPARTEVMFNLHAICNDPTTWSEPEAFKPERFLSDVCEGNAMKFTFLPFGAGRRICAGMDVANMYVPVTLANLLKKFQWLSTNEGQFPDLSEQTMAIIRSKQRPLEARIKLR